jgi:hypothetical protein
MGSRNFLEASSQQDEEQSLEEAKNYYQNQV